MPSFNLELNQRANKDNLYTLYIRINEGKLCKRVKLDFRIQKEHFNKQAKYGKWIRTINSKHAVLNLQIEEAIEKLKDKYKTLQDSGKDALNLIKKQPVAEGVLTVGKYIDNYVKTLEADAAVSYHKQIESKLGRFKEFVGPETPLADLNTEHVRKYKLHMISKGVSGVTINDNFKRIYTPIKIALAGDLIIKDPFRMHIRSKEHPKDRIRLVDEKIKALEDLIIDKTEDKSWMYHTRNMYLFSYYNAGIRIKDLIQLRMMNFSEGRLEYEMDKTGHKKSILVNKSAMAILNEYYNPDAAPTDYIFPVMDNNEGYSKFVTYLEKRKMDRTLQLRLHNHTASKATIINKNLALLSKKIEVPGRMSFHTSRHSFAEKARRTMKKSDKITMFDIKNAMGHKSIVTTERYMNSFDKESLDEAMGEIFD